MKTHKQRELVIEYEHVQLVRKKAKTNILPCGACGREVDFVSLGEAAPLFETDSTHLFQFIKTNSSHYKIDANGEIYICLVSFLACLNGKTTQTQIKMIGA